MAALFGNYYYVLNIYIINFLKIEVKVMIELVLGSGWRDEIHNN